MIYKKKQLNEIKWLITIILAVALLSGCSIAESKLENMIVKESGITKDLDYQEYQRLLIAGELNEQGYYDYPVIETEMDNTDAHHDGAVHVSFANNRYLQIKYYEDQENTQAINTTECYLNPGDPIYAKVESKNPNSNLYEIAQYRIYDYSNGEVKQLPNSLNDPSFVYQIPIDFSGSELCVVPVGKYDNRVLNMKAFYIDADGREASLSNAGTWFINGKKCVGSTTSVSPIVSYVLKFDYDNENYFFVRSIPEPFTESPETVGFIEFWKADPTSNNTEYAVQVQPYVRLVIGLDEKGTISVNGGDRMDIKSGKTWSSNKLKFGDVITIETEGTCSLIEGDFNHVQSAKDPISNGNRYTITVAEHVSQNSNVVLDVNDYLTITLSENCKHGTCSYKLDGKTVSGIINLQKNQKLELTYKITEKGFKFDNAGIWNWTQDLVGNMKQTIVIPLSVDLNYTTIYPDDWFNIVEK